MPVADRVVFVADTEHEGTGVCTELRLAVKGHRRVLMPDSDGTRGRGPEPPGHTVLRDLITVSD